MAHRAKWLDEEKGRQSEQRVMIDRDNLLDDAIIAFRPPVAQISPPLC